MDVSKVDVGSDSFRRFVDVVADSLADPDAVGTDLAARAHLSRFHFDRLAAAVLGEPPGAFRRRLLLERAAHALAVTDARVIDIAVAAGYASNEAFSRAFSRAFTATPSAFRRAGIGSVIECELPCPSGVHYQPPGGVRLPARKKVTDMNLLMDMVTHHVANVGEILDCATRVPEEILEAPITLSVEAIDDDMTLRSVLQDLVTQEEHWVSAVRGLGWPDDSDATIGGLRERHGVAGPAYCEFVADIVDREGLADTFVDTTCERAQGHPVHTFGGMIAHVLNFGAVRRTIALGALRSAGYDEVGFGDPRPVIDDAVR